MAAPFMYDKEGESSDSVEIILEKDGNGYKLTLKPDDKWMGNSERKFPIVLDPPVVTSDNINDIQDTFIASGDTANKYNNMYIRVGNRSDVGITRSFIKFTLPKLQPSSVVTHSDLKLYSKLVYNGGAQVNVHKVTGAWESDTTIWSTAPSYNSMIEDYEIVNGVDKWYTFDITAIAKEWYTSGGNNGLMLKANSEVTGDVAFYSSDYDISADAPYRPYAVMYYVDNTGLESYWTYHSQDVGRAGTGYVNDYNGSYTFIHDDISMTGSRMPINIKHVYNSYDRTSNIGFGLGWRLNLSQRVLKVSGIDYYEYIDEDGTSHYFGYDSTLGKYRDESGIDLNLSLNTASTSEYYKIVDKDKNELLFNSTGYLTKIRDKNKNEITLTYSGSTLKTVKDPAGRVITLNYNTDGNLETMVGAGETLTYSYKSASSPQLTQIKYSDGNVSTYISDLGNYLDQAINADNSGINYNLWKGAWGYRISSIREILTDGTIGGHVSVSYGFNRTTYTDEVRKAAVDKYYKYIYQFNDDGSTINILNDDGGALYYKYNSDKNNANNLKNKLQTDSKLQNTVVNYILNHNFEASNSWTYRAVSSASGAQSFTQEEKYMGYSSIKLTSSSGSGKSETYQNLQLTKGKDYVLSSYVKASDISAASGEGAYINIAYRDKDNVLQNKSEYISSTNEWTMVEVPFTLPADAYNADVTVSLGVSAASGTA
jgi:hypothetical protein